MLEKKNTGKERKDIPIKKYVRLVFILASLLGIGITLLFLLALMALNRLELLTGRAQSVILYLAVSYAVFLLIAAGVYLVIIRRLERAVIRPLEMLTDRTDAYLDYKKSEDPSRRHEHSDYFQTFSLDDTISEIGSMRKSLAGLERGIDRYEDDLEENAREKERIAVELSLAASIQDHNLPSHFPAFVERSDFDIHAFMEPARSVGGDFYDFFLIGQNRIALVIADVSGKGIPGALLMMRAKTLIKSAALSCPDPGEVLTKVNALLCEDNESSMFVTAWLGILDLSSGLLNYASAGHEWPLFRQNGSWTIIRFRQNQMPLGSIEGISYRVHSLTMQPGDILFEYSDGVTEAQNREKEQYGEERLVKAAESFAGESMEELLMTVRSSVADFVKEEEAFDDLTMLGFLLRSTDGP